MHLGYRKPLAGPGKWVARHYIGDHHYENETLAIADDFSDADGVAILSFAQAQTLARSRMVERAHNVALKIKPLTVKCVFEAYTVYFESKRSRSGREARYAADAFILPALGAVEINALRPEQVRGVACEIGQGARPYPNEEGRETAI
jgi:hypothetical protein